MTYHCISPFKTLTISFLAIINAGMLPERKLNSNTQGTETMKIVTQSKCNENVMVNNESKPSIFWSRACNSKGAIHIPITAPTKVSRVFSRNNCPKIVRKGAPKALRTAISSLRSCDLLMLSYKILSAGINININIPMKPK